MTTYYTYRSFEEFEGGRSYIGVRKCPAGKIPETDPYLGSYKDKTFKPTSKEILGLYGCKEEALQAEIDLHEKFDVAKNPHFANKARATSTKFTCNLSGKDHPNYGKPLPEETRRKLSEAQRGKTHSKETRGRMSESRRGKTLSKETRGRISEARKGVNNGQYKPRDWYHPIYGTALQKSCADLILLFGEQNLDPGCLSRVALGQRSHHKGWKLC